MATRLIRDKTLNEIADTIRDMVYGSTSTQTMRPGQMPNIINAIPSAVTTVTGNMGATPGDITENKIAYVNGVKVVGTVTDNTTITLVPTTFGATYATATYTPNTPGCAFNSVTILPIQVPSGAVTTPTSVISTTESQIITPPNGYDGFNSITVLSVQPPTINTTSVSVTSTTETQTVVPPAGYDGFDSVTVNPIPSQYKDITHVTATAGDILVNKTIVNSVGQTISGEIPFIPTSVRFIQNKNNTVIIPSGGYLAGSQTIGISPAEVEKIIPQNIASGITILGVNGSHTSG